MGTAQNAVDIACRLSRLIDKVSAVGHQTARRDKKTERIDCRQAVPSGECDDKLTVLDRGTRQHDKTAVRLMCERTLSHARHLRHSRPQWAPTRLPVTALRSWPIARSNRMESSSDWR